MPVGQLFPVPIPGSGSASNGGVNRQTGLTYAIVGADRGKLVSIESAAAVAVSIDPVARGLMFVVDIENTGAGDVTITPDSGTIDGAANFVLTKGEGCRVFSDGVDCWIMRGAPRDATTTAKGAIKLAGDLAGTAASPSVAKIGGVAVTVDTDGTLAANSDAKLATQKATKTYVDAGVAAAEALIPGDATTLAKGIVKLAGDLAGTAASPSVAKIGGVAVTVDTDGTLAANSDAKLATQKATKTYVDAAVAAGGGGVSFIGAVTAPPLVGTLAWLNQSTSTAVSASNGIFLHQPFGATQYFSALLQNAPATPWTFTAAFVVIGFNVAFNSLGIIVSDGTKIIEMFIGVNGGLNGVIFAQNSWNAFNSYNGSIARATPNLFSLILPMVWMRVSDDGTNRVWSISADGVNWQQLWSDPRTTFLTATKFGIGAKAQSTSQDVYFTCVSWKVT